jgi:hypothetical protein
MARRANDGALVKTAGFDEKEPVSIPGGSMGGPAATNPGRQAE